MKITDILSALGLRSDEITIYLTLLEQPPVTISELSRLTSLHRPLIYRAIPILIEKGLISVAPKGKQKRYTAESPRRITRLFEDAQNLFETFLPDLEASYLTKEKRPLVKYLEGRKGITWVFEDLLQTLHQGDVFYRYSSGSDIQSAEKYLPKNYRKIRDQKQLERFVITNEKTGAQKRKRLERTLKVVPKSSQPFEYNVTLIIYGLKIAFIDYNSETALIIENQILAKFQVHLFKMLFERI